MFNMLGTSCYSVAHCKLVAMELSSTPQIPPSETCLLERTRNNVKQCHQPQKHKKPLETLSRTNRTTLLLSSFWYTGQSCWRAISTITVPKQSWKQDWTSWGNFFYIYLFNVPNVDCLFLHKEVVFFSVAYWTLCYIPAPWFCDFLVAPSASCHD